MLCKGGKYTEVYCSLPSEQLASVALLNFMRPEKAIQWQLKLSLPLAYRILLLAFLQVLVHTFSPEVVVGGELATGCCWLDAKGFSVTKIPCLSDKCAHTRGGWWWRKVLVIKKL